jgi:Rieske Fe-S protein
MLAASGILVTGLVTSWELVKKLPQSGANATGSSTENTGQPPPASESTTQTVTDLQTVTVTEYVSGQQTQQVSTSQQSASSSSQASSSTSQSTPPGYVLVTPLSALSGRTSAYFNHPSRGMSILVNSAGQWKAFSATCTHAPCTVQYAGSAISCPCHGGTYDPNTGAVTGGPPPAPLPELGVLVQNCNLYVTA